MLMAIVEVYGLRKSYRRFRRPPQRALDGLDLAVDEGGVYGFLGPNGSGKTTTIRLLLGLVHSDGGTMRVLGRQTPQELPRIIGQIGALVETPTFFPGFSGRRNLQLLARTASLREKRIDEVLELVSLRDRARDRVKGYSMGMRQRLGIAAALLKRPRLLILDEPGNGLDPAGIREVRELLRRLGDTGTTVFVSSHLLAEVEQVCDRVAIINRGRLVTSGSVADVVQSARGAPTDVLVRVADLPGATAVLDAASISVRRAGDHLVVGNVEDPAYITYTLSRNNYYVSELRPLAADLESVFLSLTEGTVP
jgi:ABC-2 type transport system ATP-binding protein